MATKASLKSVLQRSHADYFNALCDSIVTLEDDSNIQIEQDAMKLEANVDDLKYDISWDWLMPVVEKIEQVNEGVPEQMLHVNLYSERREVYNAVVMFITEHNKNLEYESFNEAPYGNDDEQ